MRRSAFSEEHAALAREWRRLSRAATFVAVLTSPGAFAVFYGAYGWSFGWALLATFFFVIAFRGLIDLVAHRMIKRPSLYGADRETLLDDATARRRVWFWRGKFRLLLWVGVGGFVVLWLIAAIAGKSVAGLLDSIGAYFGDPQAQAQFLSLAISLPLLFFINFAILFGPLLFFGLKQMKGYEPGDADWGVRLQDVRGQEEPKADVERVIQLWQSGDDFRKAGGKPERGLLFIGAPGTGKTMLSKAIATSFNSPIVTMPGSGFAQTFIGMDVIVVLFLIRKARKLARKWGGQCIIFIDEIDAVGLRRQALGGGVAGAARPFPIPRSIHDVSFWGDTGALNHTGELILETAAWREKVFAARAEPSAPVYPPFMEAALGRIQGFIGGMGMGGMGGGMALNQLLVQMDGVDEPPFWRKFWTNRFNTFLDATYLVPRRVGDRTLRFPTPKPRQEQIYFIGATNVPLERLDPALVRPGRMGRHIWFRTPTKKDRQDIFDLYLGKVAHDPALDAPERREELARMTNGYSPAMIEQVCSMALTYAHSDARMAFGRTDIVEAMTTIESGTAVGVDYGPDETQAVAIHEAGHAITSHLYMQDTLSTRLSVRMRGASLGHHAAISKDERFKEWRHHQVGNLVWSLGAMAAEHVFYGENSTGVGGDVDSATRIAAYMVGFCGMGPEPIDLTGHRRPVGFTSDFVQPTPFNGTWEQRRAAEERYMDRFRDIGLRIMSRASSGSAFEGDPIGAVLSDPAKRRDAACLLGQAYLTALCAVKHNREGVLQVADELYRRKELYGDDVVAVLEAADTSRPHIDITDEDVWPVL